MSRGQMLEAFEAHKAKIARSLIDGGEGKRVRDYLERHVRLSDFEAGWEASGAVQAVDRPAIWSGEGMPSAGMACEYSLTNGGVWHECTVKYVLANGRQLVADCAGNPEGESVLHVNTCIFRPLGMIEQAAPEQLKLGAMTREALTALSEAVAKAVEAGKAAADACEDDGGTANLDRVYLYDLKRWQVEAMKAAGIDCWKSGPGEFHLSAPFDGQGNRRYAGVQAMYKSLKAAGVACSVYYCMD